MKPPGELEGRPQSGPSILKALSLGALVLGIAFAAAMLFILFGGIWLIVALLT